MLYDENNKNGVQAIIRLTSDYALYQEALQRESTVDGAIGSWATG